MCRRNDSRVSSSYSHGTSSVRLIGQTIGQNLRDTARRFPDRDALIVPYQNVRLTYGEFDSKVDALARSLLAMGIDIGDRIGIWSPNNAEWVLIQYAAARIGAILVNLNPAYRTHEIQYALGQSQCRLLFASTSYKTSDYVAMIDAVRPQVSTLERVVFLGTESWSDLLTAAAMQNDALRRREAGLQFDDPVNIQYTSGTTGYPKGATLSHHNILNNGYFVGEGCRYTEMDRVCIPVPSITASAWCSATSPARRMARHDRPRSHLRRRGDTANRPERALHEPVRCADDVHRRARPAGFQSLRFVLTAHRDHGRFAVSDRGHETVRHGDAHEGCDDLLRHDRNVAGVHSDRCR
jgi:hypothetical protein